MKEIQLTQGKVALVDDEDFEYLNQFKWCILNGRNKLYATRNLSINKKFVKSILMHRIIMNTDKDLVVDHLNGNTLDNRKCNLRNCTHGENLRNQKISIKNTSGYKGVSWSIEKKKWFTQIQLKNKKIFIGYFVNSIDAAKAYNEAAIKFYGEFANLNKID